MRRQAQRMQRMLFPPMIVLLTVAVTVRAQYGGGAGTADDPYLIETAEQLNTIGLYPEDWDKHFQLTADIDMNDLGGAKVNLIPFFGGVFDGGGHTIANLNYLVTDEDVLPGMPYIWCVGLFRMMRGWDALVMDLGLIDPNLGPDPACTLEVRGVGSLVGMLSQGWVRNCHVEGGRVGGGTTVGGLVGDCHRNGAVSESWSTAEVTGDRGVGGLVGGAAFQAEIWECHAQARVWGQANVGGLIGGSSQGCLIEDCFSTGTVEAQQQAGGLVGNLAGTVSHCYSTALVSGDLTLGGLVGLNSGLITTS